jgi:hypothetical protein
MKSSGIFSASILLALSCAPRSFPQANHNQPLGRQFTLREPDPLILEREQERMIAQGREFSFIFPRPCLSERDSSRVCGEPHGLSFGDSAHSQSISFSPQAGTEYRYLKEDIGSFEIGTLISGFRGPVSFLLDARMYTELHENFLHASTDREFVERQDKQTSGTFAYSSFSRYRADLDYDFSWGRLSGGRDVVHWGPGIYDNLVFNRSSVPFNQISFSTGIGPLRVITLYGQLTIQGERAYDTEHVSRSVYGHRYEWSFGPDWLLGISEQLIVKGYEEPFAFIPIIPLFIFKGDALEHLNNGNLAADLSWRFSERGRIYSEFLIDDMQSPSALFDENWGNKWAVMGGIQLRGTPFGIPIGAVLEAARVEPWVYTHYDPQSAQAANQGFPLGNQDGPNSQSLKLKGFARFKGGIDFINEAGLDWKGVDSGSSVNDVPPPDIKVKVFLNGADSPAFRFSQRVSVPWRSLTFSAGYELGDAPFAQASVFYRM